MTATLIVEAGACFFGRARLDLPPDLPAEERARRIQAAREDLYPPLPVRARTDVARAARINRDPDEVRDMEDDRRGDYYR